MEGATRSGLMVADEIIARADGPDGLKALSEIANAAKKANGATEKKEEKVPFFATFA